MMGRSTRRVEEWLRSSASGARRDPSSSLRSKVKAAIDSSGSEAEGESVVEPVRWSATLARRQGTLAAAILLLAVGLWLVLPRGAPEDDERSSAVSGGAPSNGIAATPDAIARLTRAGPQTLRTAVDDPLFAVITDIRKDAARAARFLAGRVPSSLVTGSSEEDR